MARRAWQTWAAYGRSKQQIRQALRSWSLESLLQVLDGWRQYSAARGAVISRLRRIMSGFTHGSSRRAFVTAAAPEPARVWETATDPEGDGYGYVTVTCRLRDGCVTVTCRRQPPPQRVTAANAPPS